MIYLAEALQQKPNSLNGCLTTQEMVGMVASLVEWTF